MNIKLREKLSSLEISYHAAELYSSTYAVREGRTREDEES